MPTLSTSCSTPDPSSRPVGAARQAGAGRQSKTLKAVQKPAQKPAKKPDQQQNQLPGQQLRSLSKDEINGLPLLAYEGKILLVDDAARLDAALDILEKESILGFDTETRPSFKRGKSYPTTLVQLAGPDLAVLIHLVQVPFSQRLAALLANPAIIKAGVAIHEDMRCLRKVCDFEPAAAVDLADMAGRLGLQARGLRTLAADIMGARISKAAQCSNWAKKELSPQQIKYAATDAWIGRELYLRLVALDKKNTNSSPCQQLR